MANEPKSETPPKNAAKTCLIILIIGIIILIIAAAIMGGLFGCKALRNLANTNSFATNQNENSSVPNYDGTYTGSSPVSQGISDATVTIAGSNLTGTGTYLGAYNAKITISITGTVDSAGRVSGSLSGSGVVNGQRVTGTGTYGGKISGTTISVSYTASGEGETHNGSIVLTKK